MAQAIERLFLPLLQQTIPEVVDYRLPFCGVAHNLMVVKIHKSYPGQARKVAHAVWGLGQAMFTKAIVVIDQHGPDVHDELAVAKYVLGRLNAQNSFEFVLGPTETLDHATRALHFGSKFCIDATRPMPGDPGAVGEGSGITGIRDESRDSGRAGRFRAPDAPMEVPDLETRDRRLGIKARWKAGESVYVMELEKNRGHLPRDVALALFEEAKDAPLPLVIFLPHGLIKQGDLNALAWATLANIDPERDIMFDETPVQVDGRWTLRRHPQHIAIDATKKTAADGFNRDWPEMQLHSTQTLARVKELLAAKGIDMPTGFLPENAV